MKIQYVSDLHLEFRSVDQIPRLLKNINADVLILAGDISAVSYDVEYKKLITFLQYYCSKYKYVLAVSGNHEYYTNNSTKENCMDAINQKLKILSKKFPNYLYLNCNTITLEINKKKYMFIGATLWTKIDIKNYKYVNSNMNDYNMIYVNKNNDIKGYTVHEMQYLHTRHKHFIKKALEKIPSNTTVVLITHHKPILEGENKDILNQAYEVDMSKVITPAVKVAIHGHTHSSYRKVINNTLYVSNPKGYPNERTGFKDDAFIDV